MAAARQAAAGNSSVRPGAGGSGITIGHGCVRVLRPAAAGAVLASGGTIVAAFNDQLKRRFPEAQRESESGV